MVTDGDYIWNISCFKWNLVFRRSGMETLTEEYKGTLNLPAGNKQ